MKKRQPKQSVATTTAQQNKRQRIDHIDRAQTLLQQSMRLADMTAAVSRVCANTDNDLSKDELMAIFGGLELVSERIAWDLRGAAEATSALWDLVKDANGGVQ